MTDLPWTLAEGPVNAENLPLDPSEAVTFIVREWLTAHCDLPLAPAQDDAN